MKRIPPNDVNSAGETLNVFPCCASVRTVCIGNDDFTALFAKEFSDYKRDRESQSDHIEFHDVPELVISSFEIVNCIDYFNSAYFCIE